MRGTQRGLELLARAAPKEEVNDRSARRTKPSLITADRSCHYEVLLENPCIVVRLPSNLNPGRVLRLVEPVTLVIGMKFRSHENAIEVEAALFNLQG